MLTGSAANECVDLLSAVLLHRDTTNVQNPDHNTSDIDCKAGEIIRRAGRCRNGMSQEVNSWSNIAFKDIIPLAYSDGIKK
jgi:hypothetical protein